jgi:hypothetical protein
MIAVLLAAIAATLVVVVLGRFDREKALRRWDFVLSGRAQKAAETLQAKLDGDTGMAGHAYELALERRATLSYDEAVRLLAIAAGTLEDAAEDRRRRLRALSVYARMAEAIVPVPPVAAARFRLPEMRSLAAIGQWLHELLMSYRERFMFRLAVIGVGLRLVLRAIRGSRTRAAATPAHPEPFETFGDSLHDFRALDFEQVESLKQLLRSAAATEKDALPAEITSR